MAEAAVNEVTTLRARLSNGLAAVQEDVRSLEATARTLRNFQPGIIPGLLQTAAYARRILSFAARHARRRASGGGPPRAPGNPPRARAGRSSSC